MEIKDIKDELKEINETFENLKGDILDDLSTMDARMKDLDDLTWYLTKAMERLKDLEDKINGD